MSQKIPNLAKWQGRQWAVALTALLLVTLTPLGWIQWRQYHMLDDLAVNQVDSIMWQAYQLEREAARLKQSLVDVADPALGVQAKDLGERYEVFLSRIGLLTQIPRRDLLTDTAQYQRTVQLLTAFSQSSDPVFANPSQIIDNSATRQQLIDRIGQLEPPLAELTREANRSVARYMDGRNLQLRQQGLLVVGLATAQIVIMLLFVGLLLRHIRRQQGQYAQLQSLSNELELARDQAEAANRGKSIFLANMSHEIRTPFQGLLGMLNLLDDASLNSRQRDYLQTARDSALHLLGVLDDILNVSTMESGTMKLSLAPVHLPRVVHEVDSLMQVAARDKGLTLKMHVATDLPHWVTADATRLRQLMFNLINNAIKFTDEGSVIAELASDPKVPSRLLFTVRDSGVGMDAETLQRLFSRFYQADDSPSRRTGGTGLGLEISRHLARLMGGDIDAQSRPGVGSTFTVSLYLPEADAPAALPPLSAELGDARKLRILVAEDHPINLKYMNILLEKMGHEATYCENGQQALQLLERNAYDVVLLDYHMPVLDGLATTEAIRALQGPKSAIKVILITADVVNETRIRAREVGVNEFASKPLQMEDLQQALARCGLLDPWAPTSAPGWPSTDPLPLSSWELHARLPEGEPPLSGYIDRESFLEILDMMPMDSLDELLKTVFEPPDGTVHVLVRAIADADRAAIGYNAHKLKGVAMLMGFRALVTISTQIEHLAMQTQDIVGAGLAQQLLRDATQTKKAIEGFQAAVTG
jgi:signal transduction histidine kinase/ActR/RegA family two-component response regulator